MQPNYEAYKDKKYLVCGLARSGVASAVLLAKLGAHVTIQDIKPKEELELVENFDEIEKYNIDLYLEKNPDDIVKNFDGIVVSPGIPCDLPFFAKAEEAGVEVIGEIELAYRLCPCKTIAVTGTNGKTTTTALLGEIMKAYRPGSVVVGNIGEPFTGEVLGLTDDVYAVAEISSFQLETAVDFKPHIAVMLNLTPDHLNRHGTVENYAAVKESIFANQDESDFAVINRDDETCRVMASRVKSSVEFFSKTQLAETHYKTILPGAHNAENVMAAITAARCAGVPDKLIRKVVGEFEGVEHRIEFVAEINGARYYNDSKATNTDAAIKALEAFEQPIVLIGGGYDKKADFTEWVGLFKGKVKKVVLVGQTAFQIKETCEKNGFFDCDIAEDFKNAVELCHAAAVDGDIVLLSPACASFGLFDNYEQRGTVFKEIVKDLI